MSPDPDDGQGRDTLYRLTCVGAVVALVVAVWMVWPLLPTRPVLRGHPAAEPTWAAACEFGAGDAREAELSFNEELRTPAGRSAGWAESIRGRRVRVRVVVADSRHVGEVLPGDEAVVVGTVASVAARQVWLRDCVLQQVKPGAAAFSGHVMSPGAAR